MKNVLLIIVALAVLTSCGGIKSDFYVNYTDEAGNAVALNSANLGYTYNMGIYMNDFGGKPGKVIQFVMEDQSDILAEGMEGKVLDMLIFETDGSLFYDAKEFDPAQTFKGTIKSVTFFKDGMMDDKIYKVVGTFNSDKFKNGEFCLQVNI